MHTGINRQQVCLLIRFYAENLFLATSDGWRLWHGDMMSLFPEGYICKPRRSLCVGLYELCRGTLGVHGKRHNRSDSVFHHRWKIT